MNEQEAYPRGKSDKKFSSKGQKRITAILDTAGRVLTESGLEDFSINKVAAEAGISLGNLQYYFPKKKDLLYALLNSLLNPAAERVQATISERGESDYDKQLLPDILAYAYDSNTSDQNCAVVWNSTAMSLYDSEAKALLNDWYIKFRELIALAVKSYNPDLTEQKVESISLFIVASIEGHAMIWRNSVSDRSDLPRIKADFIAHVLKVVED